MGHTDVFSTNGASFTLNGRKIFLNSGEIHYFRIRRDLWDTHLDAAAEAGLKTISTYVPWDWHEYEEGTFDFIGRSCPERDLDGWLARCRLRDLTCILKPGPFILAEWRGAGLPDWFMERYRDRVKMRTRSGEMVGGDGVSLFNKDYLEKVTLWYDRIMPFISQRQVDHGGPVIMMQVCNEIGVFSWLAKQADYGNEVRERFVRYLKEKYLSIGELNRIWKTTYPDFGEVELPPDGCTPYASQADRGRDHEWHLFWRSYYASYLKMLTTKARERGVTMPLYHNLPGWIYGSGYEFPVNITMYDELFGEKSEIMFGVDHIPEFLSYRNMHDDRIINDVTFAMQGGRRPLFAAEFQCGSREYHVVTNPREMELFYKASIANGLTGWNYYMFSQGRNPVRKGYSGETFYWFNPLTSEGERTSAFPLVKRMSRIIGNMEDLIVEAGRRAEICVLFYPPYYATELERPVGAECGLRFVPSAIRRPAYFDGLLKALQVLNVDYDMVDLCCAGADDLSGYLQVWAFCTDEMNAREQQVLVDYMNAGGQCVIFPYLPDRDQFQQPCTILRDALPVRPSGATSIDSPLVDILGFRDIKCANPQIVYDEQQLAGATVIARTIGGDACGFIKETGLGSVIHLGTWLGFDTEGHKPVYESLIECSGARVRQASSVSEMITVRERFTSGGEAILFAGNYYNEEHSGLITYTHPTSGETMTIPFLGKEFNWPALYAILTPIGQEISPGIRILHCTSDILGVTRTHKSVTLTLFGHRDLAGELVLEGERVTMIGSALLGQVPLEVQHVSGKAILEYHHPHDTGFEIQLLF